LSDTPEQTSKRTRGGDDDNELNKNDQQNIFCVTTGWGHSSLSFCQRTARHRLASGHENRKEFLLSLSPAHKYEGGQEQSCHPGVKDLQIFCGFKEFF
jgi:hypothetical protein